MKGQIIGFGGRLRCGKSMLANVCVKHGYKKLYFALPLKKICAEFLHTDIDNLNKLKNSNANINVTIDNDGVDFFSKKTDIPRNTVHNLLYDKKIADVRSLLQIIGTDLIRAYNMNWHIDRLREMIKPNEKYVFDDVRFPNEKQMIEDMGGDCWFVIRPKMLDNISHHPSEESLTWKNFGDKIIINDNSKEYISLLWENFISDYAKSMAARENCIVKLSLHNHNEYTDKPFTILNYLFIYEWYFKYKQCNFHKDEIKNVTLTKEGFITIEYNDKSYMLLENPFNIEDLKFFI